MTKLNPKFFFGGVLASVAYLAIAGWWLTSENVFLNFSRSYMWTNPETQYYWTARQLLSLGHGMLPRDKIVVIIGGSSVMRGTGQSSQGLWSSVLKRELGSGYEVINLALNGGGPGGQGLYLAEKLLEEGYKVIFISDVFPFGVSMSPDNSPVYRGMFFDALERGYVKPFPERMNYISNNSYKDNPELLVEHRLKAAINAYLNFDDMWSHIGYKYLFTLWTKFTSNSSFSYYASWRPRSVYLDDEVGCNDSTRHKASLEREMSIIAHAIMLKPLGGDIDASLFATIPEPLRSRTLLLMKTYSPFYMRHVSQADLHAFHNKILFAKSKYESLGVTSISAINEFKDNDFCDRDHLSESGAVILAKIIAPYVIRKARELGYEQFGDS